MPHTALTPVFVGLRTALHLLVVGLLLLVVGRAIGGSAGPMPAIALLSVLIGATYVAGGLVARGLRGRRRLALSRMWLAAMIAEWAGLLALSPDAAYLVFPLSFLALHLLGPRAGPAAVAGVTALAILTLGLHGGWSVGGVVGPVVGAAVAIAIGLGYDALAREAAERESLLRQLVATRDQLAASEREAGVAEERSRLAREIHDTVAQGLSSIQLLLHAAERADPGRPGVEHIRLARETAASNLADTRRFIRALTPPHLDGGGLSRALRRLAATQWEPQGLRVRIRVADGIELPMHVQTALLRITQGAVANVVQHADATAVTIELALDDGTVRYLVADDGRGFDPAAPAGAGRTDSFGLFAARERVGQLGGRLVVESAPGEGTTIRVDLPAEQPA